MPAAFLMAPLLLAAVLIASGVAKLRDPDSLRAGMESLHVPESLRSPAMRVVVPWLEVGLGVLLVLAPWPLNMLAAFCTLVLMAVYTWLIWTALGRDDAVDCNCFGSSTSKVTGLTLARNVTLVILAALSMMDAVAGPVIARLYSTDALWWILAFAAALWLAFTIWGDRLLPDEDAPVANEPAEKVTMTAPREASEGEELEYERLPIPFGTLHKGDESVTLRSLARKHAVLLVWVSTTCGSCAKLLPELPQWRDELAGIVDVRPVVTKLDGLEEAQPGLSQFALVDRGYAVEEMFDTFGVPAAVLLGADGRLAGGPVTGSDGIRGLVNDMKAQLEEAHIEPDADDEADTAVEAGPGEAGEPTVIVFEADAGVADAAEADAGATDAGEADAGEGANGATSAEGDDGDDAQAEHDLDQPEVQRG